MKSGFPKGNPDFFYVYGVRDMNAVSVQKYLALFFLHVLCVVLIRMPLGLVKFEYCVLFITALSFHYFLNKIGCGCGMAKFENCVFICLYTHLSLSLSYICGTWIK